MERKSWKHFEDLKKECAKALREGGFKAPKIGRMRRLPRAVEWQNVTETDKEYIGDANYTDWAERHSPRDEDGAFIEDVRANPDMLAEGSAFFDREIDSMEVEPQRLANTARAKDLLSHLKAILSPRQYQVYQMHVEDGLNFEEIALRLGVRSAGIRYAWRIVQEKLKNSMERGLE